MADVELFRRTKRAVWLIRLHNDMERTKESVYARHIECSGGDKNRYSWFTDDDDDNDGKSECYICSCPVPEYIQALMHLYIGE